MNMFIVQVCRANGRIMRSTVTYSKYQAKQVRREYENKYDQTYYIQIVRMNR